MKFHQLRALADVARTGSIQKAALARNVSQPALSKAVRELERDLGVPLLVRGAAGTTLTPFGAIMCKRFHVMQGEIQKAREEIAWLKGTLGGQVLVGVSPPVTGTRISDSFAAFLQHQPSVKLELLELRPAQIVDALRNGQIDVGLFHHYGEVDLPGVDCVALQTFDTHLAIGGAPASNEMSLEEIFKLNWLTPDLSDHGHGYLAVLSQTSGLDLPDRILRCTSISLCFHLAEQAGFISHWAADINPYLDARFSSGAMTKLRTDRPLPRMHIAMACRDEDLLSPGAVLLTRMLRSAF